MTKRLNGTRDRLKGQRRKRAPTDPVENALLRSAEAILHGDTAAEHFDHFRDCREVGHAHRIKTVRCDSQYPELSLLPTEAFCYVSGMDIDAREADSMEAIGERLRLLRTALGFTQEQYAERHGVESQQAWANYERGERPLDYRIAISVAQKDHASLDWIYRGLTAMIPIGLNEKLSEAKPTRRGRPRKSA